MIGNHLSLPIMDGCAMPALCARPVRLTAAQRHQLQKIARGQKSPHRDKVRAQIVLDADDDYPNAAIARRQHLSVDVVRKWRGRFAAEGMHGLGDRKRSGRPPRFTAVQQSQVKALACELPATSGVPLSRWSSTELAHEAVTAGMVESISGSTVRRWLRRDALKPWQYRSWIAPRAPDFAQRAAVVLDLYAGVFDGEPLGEDDYVLCSDEKTSIQARCRCHPTLPPGQARLMRVEHEYERGGAVAYLAAWDVHRGKVFGRCEPSTGIAPFGRLVEQVMTIEPYASARRVFWVVDNGSSHRGQASIDRLHKAWPTTTMIHTPVHASWLNQCEIYFSVVQRKVVTPNDFYDLTDVEARLEAFQDHYNFAARPFNWQYTIKDLDELLNRLPAHGTEPLPAAA
jgi:transposase